MARHVGVVIDRERLLDQLRHADRLATIGQLSAGVAHELNEPLSGILGFAQLARREPGLPDQAAADLDKIVKTVLYARETIRKLMIFARQVPGKRQALRLNSAIEEGLALIERSHEGVTVERELAPDLPEIQADAAQLQQVLVNLVLNAAQAMPSGGTLTIRTGRTSAGVTLAVQDTGVGMTDDVRKRIFEPFFTTKEVGRGTGLGLPVVQGIVVSHGGRIDVESAPGRGTTFTVTLPVTGASE